MSDGLKPCPFCGAGIKVFVFEDMFVFEDTAVGKFNACCAGCGAEGAYGKTRQLAIAAWNRRPIEDKLQDRIAKLEWLREVEEVRTTMREWHSDQWKRSKDANRRRSDARAALRRMWWSAREAVEVGNV